MSLLGILYIALIIATVIFLGRMALAIAGVFIPAMLWHLGEWWSYPLAVIVFFGMLYGTDLWE